MEELTITCVNKNDVERSIKYYIKDGGVLRYNQIGIKTKMFCKGGLGVKKDRINIFENETNYLLTKYPDVTTAFIRKNGLHEIKLKKYKRVIPFTPIQTPYDPSLFSKLEEMLNSISIHINKNGVGRSKLFKMSYRSCNFGYIVKRGNKKENKELSLYSKKYPLVYEEILKIGKIICPFEFLTITINHNVVCPPHIDSNNQTKSILISLGNYTKGELVIDGYGEFNTRYNAVEFDGSASIHYNNPIIGNKYSLIYYK